MESEVTKRLLMMQCLDPGPLEDLQEEKRQEARWAPLQVPTLTSQDTGISQEAVAFLKGPPRRHPLFQQPLPFPM